MLLLWKCSSKVSGRQKGCEQKKKKRRPVEPRGRMVVKCSYSARSHSNWSGRANCNLLSWTRVLVQLRRVYARYTTQGALQRGGGVFTYKNSFNEVTGCAPIIINFVVNVLWKRLKSNTISRQGVKERGAKQSFKIGKRRQTFPLHASTRYRDRQFERQDE